MTIPGFLTDPTGVIGQALAGRYHLWFLPAMIGIYLVLPALYGAVHYENGRALKPLLWVFGLFGILSGTVIGLEGILPGELVLAAHKITPELCGYCGYFILGYALSRIDPARLRRCLSASSGRRRSPRWPEWAIPAMSARRQRCCMIASPSAPARWRSACSSFSAR